MGMEIGAVQIPGADIGAVQSSITEFSGSINLFINGYITETDNVDLFVRGLDTEIRDIDLFVNGFETNTNIIELFINGKELQDNNLDLFINGKDNITQILDLFIFNSELTSSNFDLFVGGFEVNNKNINLYINGKEFLTKNLDLFIRNSISVDTNIDLFIYGRESISKEITLSIHGTTSGLPPLEAGDDDFGITLEQLFKNADYNPQIIGRFISDPNSVTIEVWDNDGNIIVLTNNECYQISDTGRWAWSTVNLSPLTKVVSQFVYRMTGDNLEVFTSQFILHTRRKNSLDKVPRDGSQIRKI